MASIMPITRSEFEAKVSRAEAAILDFYQATCAPRRVLELRLERIAEQYAGRVPVYRIDTERGPLLRDGLGVKSIPTVLIFRNGRQGEWLDGLVTEDELRAAFERVR